MQIDLTGKTALVTGGSRGIGRATCLLLARCGADVVFGYHSDRKAAESLLHEIRSMGRQAASVSGDIALPETTRRLFEEALAWGGADIAVGNAGIWKRAPIDEMTLEQWREMIDVNLTSMFLLCRQSVRAMSDTGRGGRIVLVGSTAGQRGEAFHSHYAASKGAIQSLVKSLAAEIAPLGIQVNCVAPGWVETDMTVECFGNPAFRQAVEKTIPLGLPASADQVASTILFLVSDLASHLQGEILNVNGGSVLCG